MELAADFEKGSHSDDQVIIYPSDMELHRCQDGTRIFITEVENWYGNDAHERQREREAFEARAVDVVQLPPIVEDENYFGNDAHKLARMSGEEPQ